MTGRVRYLSALVISLLLVSTVFAPVADGSPNEAEAKCEYDIYIEIDTTGNNSLSPETKRIIVNAFERAPVSNSNVSSGIDIHLIENDTGLRANGTVHSQPKPGAGNDIYDFYSNHSDYSDRGYYYVLVTDDVAFNGSSEYAGAGTDGIAAMELTGRPEYTASLFMHELGHAMGLRADMEGIDERTYSGDEYDSVMNYNGMYGKTTYSDGTDEVGRDEWELIIEDSQKSDTDCVDS
jgi:hypothetical protein